MADIKAITKQERRKQLAQHFETLQHAKEMHRDSNIKDRFDYLERKLDGIFSILDQIQDGTKECYLDSLNQYPMGSYLEELTRQNSQ